jgi:hypothetical protein
VPRCRSFTRGMLAKTRLVMASLWHISIRLAGIRPSCGSRRRQKWYPRREQIEGFSDDRAGALGAGGFATIRDIHSIGVEGESLTADIEKTISDLERQREVIDRALSALREITGSAHTVAKRSPAASVKKGAKRRISPEGRARIAEAQRQRWAAKHAAEASPASKKAGTGSGMSRKQPKAKKAARKKRTGSQPVTAAADQV